MSHEDTPAFPCLPPLGPDGTSAAGYPFVSSGISIRDYFAAKALQGMLACPVQPQSGPDMYARDAYALADAMLKESKL